MCVQFIAHAWFEQKKGVKIAYNYPAAVKQGALCKNCSILRALSTTIECTCVQGLSGFNESNLSDSRIIADVAQNEAA